MIRRSFALAVLFAGACATPVTNLKGGDSTDDTDPDGYKPGEDSADTFTFDTSVDPGGNGGANNGTPNGGVNGNNGANGGNGGGNGFPNGGFGTGLPGLGTGLGGGLGTGLGGGTGFPGLGTGLGGTGFTPSTGAPTLPVAPIVPLAVPLGSQPGAVFAFP